MSQCSIKWDLLESISLRLFSTLPAVKVQKSYFSRDDDDEAPEAMLESRAPSFFFYPFLTFNEIDSLFQSVGICVAIIQNQGSCKSKRVDGHFSLLIPLRL